jgi:5-methylthioadenosine/S-adenosylhomocysteine deaminase
MMAELGVRFALGTDSTCSDAFRMVEAAESRQRIAFGIGVGDFCVVVAGSNMRRRASPMQLASREMTGEIAVGQAADLLLIDITGPEFAPSWGLDWELVRFNNREQITAVLVARKLRLWRGWPADWDTESLIREVRAVAADAVATAPIKRTHPISHEHRAKHFHPPGKRS